MNYQFPWIEAFVKVLETGSFTEAARVLGVTKSVVSKRVQDLEQALGAKLLHRSTRRLTPTDVGQGFYEKTRSILIDLDGAVEDVTKSGGRLTGAIRISAPMSFGTMHLGPALYPFLRRHAQLQVALSLNDQRTDLQTEGFDLGIRIGRPGDSSLIGRKLGISRRVLVCSPEYARRKGIPATPEELRDHDCIHYLTVNPNQLWQFERPNGEIRSAPINARFIVNNGEATRDAACAGLGISVQPLFLAWEAIRDGRLQILPNFKLADDYIYALYPQDRHRSEKVRAIVEYLSGCWQQPAWERVIHP
ncbi:LysR family transcriptional regulator [Massilia sp. YIM B04103]|uniref:LysR family transcriptional regulator n=1 Tax=Massilia sp. YIM B04103 TaxID=2963106 RepID=UPI00210A10F8|nr:LysR family transcriptional regulator [Massilia sp. YIM B04103]